MYTMQNMDDHCVVFYFQLVVQLQPIISSTKSSTKLAMMMMMNLLIVMMIMNECMNVCGMVVINRATKEIFWPNRFNSRFETKIEQTTDLFQVACSHYVVA